MLMRRHCALSSAAAAPEPAEGHGRGLAAASRLLLGLVVAAASASTAAAGAATTCGRHGASSCDAPPAPAALLQTGTASSAYRMAGRPHDNADGTDHADRREVLALNLNTVKRLEGSQEASYYDAKKGPKKGSKAEKADEEGDEKGEKKAGGKGDEKAEGDAPSGGDAGSGRSTAIVPFGKEDTGRALQSKAEVTQDTLVDAIENAQVAEIKRSIFRSLTRLRAAEIKEFDTIARLETQAIDEYNDNHHYREENPLDYIHKEEPQVKKDKYTSFHGD